MVTILAIITNLMLRITINGSSIGLYFVLGRLF